VLALVSPGFFDKLIGHAKVEEAYKYFSSTGAQLLREDTLFRQCFRGIQRHRHALDRRDRDADPGERGYRVPARHHGHLRHLRSACKPDRDRKHHGAADLCPPGRQRHRCQDRGLDHLTGLVTFISAPTAQPYADFLFDVPVRLDTDHLPVVAVA
jgi:hypothetical protein